MSIYVKPAVIPAWGELNTTSADMVEPADSAVQAGWPESATPPARQYFNWLFYFVTSAVRYFCQRGIADYDAAESYQLNARIIGDDGLTYVSIQNANVGHTPSSSPTWWTRWGFTLAQLVGALIPSSPPQRATLGSDVALTANTQTVILTKVVTFPSSGSTYRVDIRYTMWAVVSANVINAAVIDTTNSRSFAASGRNSNGTGYEGLAASEISTQTYAAGSTATFTLQAIVNNSGNSVKASSGFNPLSPSEPTYLEITPVLAS